MTTTVETRPAATSIFPALCDKCLPLIERYHADLLEHDKKAIEANPACPFLHWTTSTGTHLTFMPAADDEAYPPRGVYVPFLFGTADRDHLLKSVVTLAEYHAKNNAGACCYHFNGRRLIYIDAAQALVIAKDYRRRIENAWNAAR